MEKREPNIKTPMLPAVYRVGSVVHETKDVFTLSLAPTDQGPLPTFLPGQFNMLYQFGCGEVAISISSDPMQTEGLLHTIRSVGPVTEHLRKARVGDEIGVRGPFGTAWPTEVLQDDVLLIAGGIGLAPLRPMIWTLLRAKKNITLIYGARQPQDIIFREDLAAWQAHGMNVSMTVDSADLHWQGHVGVVTGLIGKSILRPGHTAALICGPEIMIKYAIQALLRSEIDPYHIWISLERNMQCAVGFCGHCQYGPYFMCKDGPVFSYPSVQKWLKIQEL
jgi:NAD(P)H-flavin reductase